MRNIQKVRTSCNSPPNAPEREVYRIEDLPAEVAEVIQGAKMNPAHDRLNELLGIAEGEPKQAG